MCRSFAGTCYRAANWQFLGQTQGRGRLEPNHESRTSKKDILVYPLQSDWQQCLRNGAHAVDLKKRYRNDLRASRTPTIDDAFVSLWEEVVHLFHDVAAQYDQQWRVRKRVIDSLILMLLSRGLPRQNRARRQTRTLRAFSPGYHEPALRQSRRETQGTFLQGGTEWAPKDENVPLPITTLCPCAATIRENAPGVIRTPDLQIRSPSQEDEERQD